MGNNTSVQQHTTSDAIALILDATNNKNNNFRYGFR